VPRTLKLTIAYDGSAYAGWQRQENGLGIQAVLEDEIATIVGAHNPLIAAGRTDAGVHAAAQVASIRIDHPIRCDDLLRALNARLKAGDIRVRAVEEVADEFNARIFAKTKTYRYAIWNGAAPNPFIRHVVWHVPHPVDMARMVDAAGALVGEQDFAAFQGRGGDVTKTTVRRVLSAEIRLVDVDNDQPTAISPLILGPPKSEGRMIRIELVGTGFLRHMVRNIAGTLVDIGRGFLEPADMRRIIDSRDRREAGQTAPARGLMLWRVDY
jgi:tRNA pseudouridine38-40 synthase